jgi:hypothetical protein
VSLEMVESRIQWNQWWSRQSYSESRFEEGGGHNRYRDLEGI